MPILYDLAYSKSSSENSNGGPDGDDVVYLSDLDDNEKIIGGLDAAETYYVWIKSKNAIGTSNYFGPLQVQTDGTYSADDVNFSINATGFDRVSASWQQPTGKSLKFQLGKMINGEFDPFFDRSQTKLSYAESNLSPGTLIEYVLRVYNEFGILINSISASVTTPDLPIPLISLSPVGNTINASITIPVWILNVEYQYNTASDFSEGGDVQTVSRNIPYDLSTTFSKTENDSHPTNTTMYYRARASYGLEFGPWSEIVSALTGQFLPPSKPSITGLTSPGTGQVRLRGKYANSDWRNESIQVYHRRSNSDPFELVDSFSRRNNLKDIDSRDERFEILYTGVSSEYWEYGIKCTNTSGPSEPSYDTDSLVVS